MSTTGIAVVVGLLVVVRPRVRLTLCWEVVRFCCCRFYCFTWPTLLSRPRSDLPSHVYMYQRLGVRSNEIY